MDPHSFPSPFPNMVGRGPKIIHVLNAYYYTVLQVGASITPHAEVKASHSPNPLSSLKSLCLPPTMCLWERTSYGVWLCH